MDEPRRSPSRSRLSCGRSPRRLPRRSAGGHGAHNAAPLPRKRLRCSPFRLPKSCANISKRIVCISFVCPPLRTMHRRDTCCAQVVGSSRCDGCGGDDENVVRETAAAHPDGTEIQASNNSSMLEIKKLCSTTSGIPTVSRVS
jgi:hypothetical protein